MKRTAPLQLSDVARGERGACPRAQRIRLPRDHRSRRGRPAAATTKSRSGTRPSTSRRFSTQQRPVEGPGDLCRVEGAPAPRPLPAAPEHPHTRPLAARSRLAHGPETARRAVQVAERGGSAWRLRNIQAWNSHMDWGIACLGDKKLGPAGFLPGIMRGRAPLCVLAL
jgi:hypothetical protein